MKEMITRKFNDGLDYVKDHMSPGMKSMYNDIDYRITLQKITIVEDRLVKGEDVPKSDVDEIELRLKQLIEVCNWAIDPPADKNLQRTLQKLNPMRRMLLNAREHAKGIQEMIQNDIQEKFILTKPLKKASAKDDSEDSDETLSKSFYTLKKEHRFSE